MVFLFFSVLDEKKNKNACGAIFLGVGVGDDQPSNISGYTPSERQETSDNKGRGTNFSAINLIFPEVETIL